jgi:DNA-binding NarL/FixJ family response regulator
VSTLPANVPAEVQPTRPVRVLVVDDDHLMGTRLRELLIDFEHIVVGLASSSIHALVLVKALRPDVVVTDLRMPGMNGLQLAAELRRLDDPPGVVIVSAYDDASLKAEAANAGVDSYVVKGSPGEQIHHAVVEAAARTARLSTLGS